MTTGKRSSRKPKRTKNALHAVVVLSLLGASGFLTVEMQKRKEENRVPEYGVAIQPRPGQAQRASTAEYRFERLSGPDRTVVRDANGSVVATFTDGARTAVLTGPSRTFAEPRTTKAKVVTDSWVRLMPKAWAKGAQKAGWFRDWFKEYLGSNRPDIFAVAMQYGDGAPSKKNAQGMRYVGDAVFGPINPEGTETGDMRLEQSDFYDYLGVPWQFRDGVLQYPEQPKYGALDCSGFIRMVFGYRSGFHLNSSDDSQDTGLPRTANNMAVSDIGVPVLPLTATGDSDPLKAYERPTSIDLLQPGDLVFFEIDKRTGKRLDHTGIYLGLDTDGHPRFLSSREEANGPTLGDLGGDSRLDGNGFYAQGLRSAKRL